MMTHPMLRFALAGAFAGLMLSPSMAQDSVKIISVVELSGAGATVGTNFKNGADIAVAEINAKGGLFGKKI